MQYELEVEHTAGLETAKEDLKEKNKGRSILMWRIIAVTMIFLVIATLIYFVIKGAVWIYNGVFGRSNQASSRSVTNLPAGINSNASSEAPPPPAISNFNVVPVPNSGDALVPVGGVNAGGVQTANPGGCPDYLGDTEACVPNPPSG